MYGYGDEGPQPSFGQHAPQRMVFDGKRMRKPIQRKTVDYNSVLIRYLQMRASCRDERDFPELGPHVDYIKDLVPPHVSNPVSSMCLKFVHTSTNKVRCPINVVTWTPEGRRLITGSTSGEFTLWNGLTFNFETILQAHDTAVRTMIWSHNDNWLVTGDHGGFIKYWQSNMNNVKAFQAHKESVRDLSFCPTDAKFVSCSDDVTLKIWDFATTKLEHSLTGHGWDVKSVSWHPQKSLVASGSKDNLIKLWDAKSGRNINTLHGHKNTVLKVRWNQNGNWLVSASRDQLLKLYDLRMMKEAQTFRAHKREVTSVTWHPFHENLLVSGGFDGSIIYWLVGLDDPQAEVAAHESSVWDLQWHPCGHILCSGSNDHTTKFWCRNRPGDTLKDKHTVVSKTGESAYEETMTTSKTTGEVVAPGITAGQEKVPGLSNTLQSAMTSLPTPLPPMQSSDRVSGGPDRRAKGHSDNKNPRNQPYSNNHRPPPPQQNAYPPNMMPPPGQMNPGFPMGFPPNMPPNFFPPGMPPNMIPPGFPPNYPNQVTRS